ncbi:MAG TPA: helix-turn-helix domain-containing protein [Gaiellaceae bacterium]|nr:helix-turn-helix domain-containing protein [Gaiellaceae bacterium]
MFEIGSSLKEARLRQALDLNDAEAATKIRAKYLGALEDERFEILPAQTYVKGFLRAYADYLGLDGQLYVDEFNSRYVPGDEDVALVRPRRNPAASRAHRRMESSVLLLALAGIAAAAALVFVAWKWGGSERQDIPNLGPTETKTATQASAAAGRCVAAASSPWIAFELAGIRSGSRVTVYRGASTAGRFLFEGTIEAGRRMCWAGGQLWVEAPRAENLVARINGRRVALPRGAQQFVASRVGVRSAAE